MEKNKKIAYLIYHSIFSLLNSTISFNYLISQTQSGWFQPQQTFLLGG